MTISMRRSTSSKMTSCSGATTPRLRLDFEYRFINLTLEDVIEVIRLSDPAHAEALHHRYCDFWLVDGELELNAPTFGLARPHKRQRRKPGNAG